MTLLGGLVAMKGGWGSGPTSVPAWGQPRSGGTGKDGAGFYAASVKRFRPELTKHGITLPDKFLRDLRKACSHLVVNEVLAGDDVKTILAP